MNTGSSHQIIKVLRYSGEFSCTDHELAVTLDIVSWPDLQPDENRIQIVTTVAELRKMLVCAVPDPATDEPCEQYTNNQVGAALSALNKLEWARSAELLENLGFKVEMRPGRPPLARVADYSSSIFG